VQSALRNNLGEITGTIEFVERRSSSPQPISERIQIESSKVSARKAAAPKISSGDIKKEVKPKTST